MEKIRVVIVENEAILLESLVLILEEDEHIEVVSYFVNAEDALEALPRLQPNVILMDIDLGKNRMSGIEAIKYVKQISPDTAIMILTIYEDTDKVFSALQEGALGYVLKSSTSAKIKSAIVELYEGGAPMSPSIARKIVLSLSPNNVAEIHNSLLTAREQEILEQIAAGKIEKEVAALLFISPTTVKKHIANIYAKLQVNNRVEALNKYYNK